MIAPSVPHLLLQHDLGTSPIAFRLVFIALAYNRVSKKHLRGVWDLFPFHLALQTTVEMPALQNETSSTQAILGPNYQLTSSNIIGNRKD